MVQLYRLDTQRSMPYNVVNMNYHSLIRPAAIMALSTMGWALPTMGEDAQRRGVSVNVPTAKETQCHNISGGVGGSDLSPLSQLLVWTYYACDGKVSTRQGESWGEVVITQTQGPGLRSSHWSSTQRWTGLTRLYNTHPAFPLGNEVRVRSTEYTTGIGAGGGRGTYWFSTNSSMEADWEAQRGYGIPLP